MKRHLFIICSLLLLLTSCDDGDILTVDLEFDEVLENCENFEEYHLVYDTRDDPNEALILIFPKSDENNVFFTHATTEGTPEELTIDKSTVRFIYRTYNRELTSSDMCAVVAPADLTIRDDYEAGSGDVYITSTIVDDDNDGVPNEAEGIAGLPNEDGIYMDSLDTDGDGIPNYLDIDDDGDNVKTINELDDDNADGDDDPLTNPLDTDGDGTPDYLDDDDDGDDILTRYEDANGENGPGDDRIAVNDVLIPLYLNPAEAIAYIPDPNEDYLAFDNQYTRTVETTFIIKDTDLTIFRTTEITLGTLITTLNDFDPNEEDDD